MQKFEPLIPGKFYHVYNRGINGESIFRGEKNYRYFLSRYAVHTFLVVETFAYCLLNNHFHLLVKVRHLIENDSAVKPNNTEKNTSRCFSNFFNSYSQSFNRMYDRSGGLFEGPFRRKCIDNSKYLKHVINYIHFNPQHHKMIEDYREWPYSSYQSYLSKSPTKLSRVGGLDLLGNNLDIDVDFLANLRNTGLYNYTLNIEELTL